MENAHILIVENEKLINRLLMIAQGIDLGDFQQAAVASGRIVSFGTKTTERLLRKLTCLHCNPIEIGYLNWPNKP